MAKIKICERPVLCLTLKSRRPGQADLKIGRLGTPTAPQQVPSLPIEARRPGGPQNRKIRNSNGPEASSESSDFRLCFPAEGAARLGRARGLWTEGGEGGGWREGLGDWLAVGSRFASTDCSWIYRGEVGLEVG